MNIEFTDRYKAMGIPYPDPDTMCLGPCEGTGYVPVNREDDNPIYNALWQKAEKEKPTDDGWHFVTCPMCSGTRLNPNPQPPDYKKKYEYADKHIKELMHIQESNLENNDPYMRGLHNGLALAYSIFHPELIIEKVMK